MQLTSLRTHGAASDPDHPKYDESRELDPGALQVSVDAGYDVVAFDTPVDRDVTAEGGREDGRASAAVWADQGLAQGATVYAVFYEPYAEETRDVTLEYLEEFANELDRRGYKAGLAAPTPALQALLASVGNDGLEELLGCRVGPIGWNNDGAPDAPHNAHAKRAGAANLKQMTPAALWATDAEESELIVLRTPYGSHLENQKADGAFTSPEAGSDGGEGASDSTSGDGTSRRGSDDRPPQYNENNDDTLHRNSEGDLDGGASDVDLGDPTQRSDDDSDKSEPPTPGEPPALGEPPAPGDAPEPARKSPAKKAPAKKASRTS